MFLGYAELFHKQTHGIDEFSDKNIQEHYITIMTIKNPIKYLKFMNFINQMDGETYYDYICENNHTELYQHREILFYILIRTKNLPFIKEHESIRNFLLIQENLYLPSQLHIFEKKVLDTGESICILKTFWIKCIQRKWKKICQYNNKRLKEIKTLKYIKNKEYGYHKQLMGIRGLWHSKIYLI